MKRIAYIELDTHAELVGNFMELMQDSKMFQVDYFLSERIVQQLKIEASENIFLSSSTTILHQLSSQNYDLILIGTIHRYFNTFEKIFDKYNVSLLVHNQNFAKLSKFDLFKNTFKKDVIYRLKLLLKESLLKSPSLHKKAKNLLFLDRKVGGKCLPLFYTKFQQKEKTEVVTIVVPGTVSQKRRDYEMILSKIVGFSTPCRLVFLGKAAGEELMWIKDFERENEIISVVYFTEKISQEQFDEWMLKADVLWCPIQERMEFFSNEEIYGITKITGNVGDAIRYAKPAIFPRSYSADYPFVFQQKANVERQILDIKKQFDYDFLQEFSKEKASEELHKVLLELI